MKVLLSAVINQFIGIGLGFIFFYHDDSRESSPYFVVTKMVQCKGTICNAVLEMDNIAILVPFDSTQVNVGDTIYLRK